MMKSENLENVLKDFPIKHPLTTSQVADLIGFARHSVSQLCTDGKMEIPHYKVGGRYIFDLKDVKAYVLKSRR
jgi:excisionase family DNA binding protein